MFHYFIDYKKVYEEISQKTIWITMKINNGDHTLFDTITALFEEKENAVLMASILDDWFNIGWGETRMLVICFISSWKTS